jgi:hypothetical protein
MGWASLLIKKVLVLAKPDYQYENGGSMFKGTITYREAGTVQKLEVKQDNVFKLLEVMSRFDDLSVIEVHIIKEVV